MDIQLLVISYIICFAGAFALIYALQQGLIE